MPNTDKRVELLDSPFFNHVRNTIGRVTELLSRQYHLSPEEISTSLISSGYASYIGHMHPMYLLGRHESEIAKCVADNFFSTHEERRCDDPFVGYEYKHDYWMGWFLVTLAGYSHLTVESLLRQYGLDSIRDSYGILHEVNEEYAVERFLE